MARLARAHEMADVLIAGAERVDPGQAVAGLAALGHRVVLCEGGPTWLGELVAAGRLDELCLTISPLMGGDPLPVSVAPPGAPLARLVVMALSMPEVTSYRADGNPPGAAAPGGWSLAALGGASPADTFLEPVNSDITSPRRGGKDSKDSRAHPRERGRSVADGKLDDLHDDQDHGDGEV